MTSAVEKLAKAKWESSGLTKRDAQRLRFKALPGKAVVKLSPAFQPVGALQLPYFDFHGRPTKFYRLRYLEVPPGFAGTLKKPQRYVQAPGTLNECYFPPLLDKPWGRVLASPTEALLITEGELKAAAATRLGFPTIGLGGVDVWRSAKRKLPLLPQLEAINWKGRPVVVVFDSDSVANPDVLRAQRQLARALLERGAVPTVARLPPEHGKGLDDFLIARGAEGLEKVLKSAQAFEDSDALWGLNEEVVYVRNPGLVVTRAGGQRMASAHFSTSVYVNHQHTEYTKGGIPRRVSTAKRWLEWPHRFEASALTYAPGKPSLVGGKWNLWKGWGVEPKKGDVSPWRALLDYLFEGEAPAARQWFERWCAYPFQHPGTKLYTSCLFWGAHHGTGKTAVGYILKDIYGENGIEVKSHHLNGGFNEWAENKQFVVGDEVTGSDKRADADNLKGLITEEEMVVNAKYVPMYRVPACVNYYFTSNHPDAFFLDDTDRRFFVHEVRHKPGPPELYQRFDKWRRNGGAAYLFHHLLTLPLGSWDPRAHAYTTRAKREMVLNTKSDLGVWCRAMLEDVTPHLLPLGDAVSRKADLLTATQLLRCYDSEGSTKTSAIAVGRELQRCGVPQLPVTYVSGAGLIRPYAVRNAEKWTRAAPREVAAHWWAAFNPKARRF